MIIYIYAISPIDFWFGWTPLDKALEGVHPDDDFAREFYDDILTRFEKVKPWALAAGWEGDMRGGAYFVPIPWETGGYEFLLAWKQDNNGMTFVVSPTPLSWLDEEYDAHIFAGP